MDCYKVKILTELRLKRKRDGTTCYTCVGIDNNSIIAIVSSFTAEMNNVAVGKCIILTGHRLYKGNDKVFVTITETTKVCYIIFFLNITGLFIHCYSILFQLMTRCS